MIADLCFGLIRAYAKVWMSVKSKVLLFGEEHLEDTPRGRRVYVVLNHATSYDLVALFSLSANRFSVVMDQAAFEFPVFGRLLSGAGFIPLDKQVSEAAIRRAVETVSAGIPLVMSLNEGYTAVGVPGHERPRTGGVRVAHLAGADLYPVFVMLEEGRRRLLSYQGRGGRTHAFTTFRDALYVVSFLPPIPASSFAPDASYQSYRAIAERLFEQGNRELERYTPMLREQPYAGLRRRGGSDRSVTW